MKKVVLFTLSLSLLSVHPTRCEKSKEEYGVIGAGAVITLFGLKIMNNATKKDGTKKQGFFGALLTACGVAMIAGGPGTLKGWQTKNRGWLEKKLQEGKQKFDEFDGEARKIAAVNALNGQIDREPDEWKKIGLQCLLWAIQNDPTRLLAKNIPWSMLIKANLN